MTLAATEDRQGLSPVQWAVRGLTPGYFALVMASGIISVGLNLIGQTWLSMALLVIAIAAFLFQNLSV